VSLEPVTEPPITLTIAGSDSSAGAGIQADLKVFHYYKVYGLTAVSGIVAESPKTVRSWQATSASLLSDQLQCLLETYPISAIKTGALFTPELAETVANTLAPLNVPLVIDPVGVASTGSSLGGNDLLSAIAEYLFPLATLITPNLMEARCISGQSTSNLEALADFLSSQYANNFLVKGGHSDEDVARDILATPNGQKTEFSLPKIPNADYHGTGCTLSAAITAEIALGKTLEQAILSAKKFLHTAITTAHHWHEVEALNTFRNS